MRGIEPYADNIAERLRGNDVHCDKVAVLHPSPPRGRGKLNALIIKPTALRRLINSIDVLVQIQLPNINLLQKFVLVVDNPIGRRNGNTRLSGRPVSDRSKGKIIAI